MDQSQDLVETKDVISSDGYPVPISSPDTSTVKHNQVESVKHSSPKPVKQDLIELVDQDQPKPVPQDQPAPSKQDPPKPIKQDLPKSDKEDKASVVIQGHDQGVSSAAVPNEASLELSDYKPSDKDIQTLSSDEPTELVDSHSNVMDEIEIDSSSSKEGKSATVKEGSFVQVEKDGSMFVRADTDYLQSRAEGKMALQGSQKRSDGGVQFSNKLIYSLD